ncbi:MAG: type II secretion system protein [Armatimonadota bacterium]|nr:type II secretion system GspH family protein [bacterium]
MITFSSARKKQRGFTLFEVLIVSGIMGFMLASIAAMIVSSMMTYDRATARTFRDTDAATALQAIVTDVREARYVNPLDACGSAVTEGDRLEIVFPENSDGREYFDRTTKDIDNPTYYYLSNSTGTVGASGTWLWQSGRRGTRCLAKDIKSVTFKKDSDIPKEILVSVEAYVKPRYSDANNDDQTTTTLTERAVYMRNYYEN